MLIYTNTAAIASGDIYFSFETQGTASPGANVDILDISSLRYMFDLYGSSSLIDVVSAMPGAMTLTVEDELSNLGTLYDALSNEIGTYSVAATNSGLLPVANVTMYLRERGSATFTPTRFVLDWPGVSYDERNKHLALQLDPYITSQNTHTCFVQNIAASKKMNFHYEGGTGGGGSIATAALTGDFIQAVVSNLEAGATTLFEPYYLDTAFGNVGTQNTTQPVYGTSPPTEPLDGNVMPLVVDPAELSSSYFGTDDANTFANATNQRAFDVVGALAALDGSIFGTAFGVNFWTHRNRNTNNTTISADAVEDIKFTIVPKTVRSVNLTIQNTPSLTYTSNSLPYFGDIGSGGVTPGLPVNVIEAGFPYSEQRVDIGFAQAFPVLNRAEYNTTYGDANFYADPGTWGAQTIAATPNMQYLDVEGINLAGSMEAYKTATGADSARIDQTRVEATIHGISKVRPYQTIKFDSTLARFSGRHYRPSQIEYDLKNDKIVLTAYEIL